MIELNQLINGLKNYLEAEFLPKVTGIEKWLIGASLSMLLDKGTEVFNELKQNPFIKTMEIIDSNDQIDIDRLYSALIEQARKSAVTFKMPLVGSVTLKSEDLEKIYSEIKGAK